jgi:hypothetical protein
MGAGVLTLFSAIARSGCVSGFQIQGIRESADDQKGGYDWDLVDGYDTLP